MKSEIFVRDRFGVISEPIFDFKQFDAVIRASDVGTWSLRVPTDTRATKALQAPGAGIVLKRDGKKIFAGPMRKDEPKWSQEQDEVILSGVSDDWLLWNLICRPSVANWDHPEGKVFANDAYDVRSGAAETVIKGYVSGNSQDEDRRAPDQGPLQIGPNLLRGFDVIGRARLQYLGDLIRELAGLGGLSFSVVDNLFEVDVPNDRERDQVFSIESGNLQEFDFMRTAPTGTDVLVAGGGEQEDRIFARCRDLAAEELWNAHIEIYRDERSTSDRAELIQAGDKELLDRAEITQVSLRAIDVPNRAFGKNWNVNDFVNVNGIRSQVGEAKITLDENGETVTPTIDSVTSLTTQSMIQLYDSVRSLKRQILDLQRTR